MRAETATERGLEMSFQKIGNTKTLVKTNRQSPNLVDAENFCNKSSVLFFAVKDILQKHTDPFPGASNIRKFGDVLHRESHVRQGAPRDTSNESGKELPAAGAFFNTKHHKLANGDRAPKHINDRRQPEIHGDGGPGHFDVEKGGRFLYSDG